MHRADRVGQRDRDLLDALLPGDHGNSPQAAGIVRGVRHLEAANPVANHAAEREPHHLLVDGDPGDETHPRGDEAQGGLRHRGAHEAKPLPRILAMEANGHGHVRARREVHGMEADPIHGRSDCHQVVRRQAGGAPQALVAVAGRRVDDLDEPTGAHGAHRSDRIRKRGAPSSTSCAFSTHASTIVPVTPAGTAFIIFMTSIRHTTVSGSTRAPTSTNGGAPGA